MFSWPSRAVQLLGRHLVVLLSVVVGSSLALGALVWHAPGSPRGQHEGFVVWMLAFWKGLLSGDLGASYRGISVAELVFKGAAISLPIVLAALALSLSLAFGFALVVHGQSQIGSRFGRAVLHVTSLVPAFLLAYFAIIVLAVPPDGFLPSLFAVFILAVADGTLGDLSLRIEAELSILRRKDFVLSAELRGLSMPRRLARHLVIPLAEAGASRIGFLLGGAVIVEKVLGLPGLGWIGYQAAVEGDFVLLLAITVLVTALVGGSRLLVVGLRLVIDPRARRMLRGSA